MTAKLAEIQSAIQQAILKGGRPDVSLLRPPEKGSAGARLDVYRNGYTSRLTEFIGNDYPKLGCYMGDVKFNSMARGYIAQHPSDTPNARWYSRHLPEFLRRAHPWSRHPQLSELAELERALNDAFDAPESSFTTMEDLSAVDPAGFGAVCFTLSPTVRRFAVRTNVTSLWSSLKCDETPPHPLTLDHNQEILVWRQGSASRFRMLGDEEAMAIDAAAEGVSFAVVCEMIAAMDDLDSAAHRAATYLRGWIEAEIIAALKGENRQDPAA